jgi:hypothetical protein
MQGKDDSFFRRNRRYGRRTVSKWGGRSRGGYRSRRSYSTSSYRSGGYSASTSSAASSTVSNPQTSSTGIDTQLVHYGSSRLGPRSYGGGGGIGLFFVFMFVAIGIPVILATPLAILFAPVFFIGCILCLLIGCIKG